MSLTDNDEDLRQELREIQDDAEKGNAVAQGSLGAIYADGIVVPKDVAEAVKWYRRAAEQGYASAQFSLGLMYAEGEGVPKDAVQTYAWLNIAAGQGDQDAKKAREHFVKFMTREEISRAQQLAHEYWEAYVLPFRN